MADAGWKPDPNERHEWRYFDGAGWSDQVSDAGRQTVDPYDPTAIPPPPTAPPARPKHVSYKLVLLDRRGDQLYDAPFQSADLAMRFAETNPEITLRRTATSVLLRGALQPNTKRWRTAVIIEIDQDTGEQAEYHRLHC